MNRIHLLSLMTVLLLGPQIGYASAGSHGGFVYQCGDQVELVDLKEVSQISFLAERIEIVSDERNYKAILNEKLEILAESFPEISKMTNEVINLIEQKFQYMGVETSKSNDLGYYPEIPDCQVVPLIQYKDLSSRYLDWSNLKMRHDIIYLDDTIYSKINSFHKAALLIHEALYKIARLKQNHFSRGKLFYQDLLLNSLPIRRIVALLFSSNFEENEEVFNKLVNYYLKPETRHIPLSFKFQFCLERQFINDQPNKIPLEEFIPALSFFIEENPLTKKSGYYSKKPSLKKWTKEKYTQAGVYEKKDQRCDGKPGSSYLIETDEFTITSESRFYFSNSVTSGTYKKPTLVNAKAEVRAISRSGKLLASKKPRRIQGKYPLGLTLSRKTKYLDFFSAHFVDRSYYYYLKDRDYLTVTTDQKKLDEESREFVDAQ